MEGKVALAVSAKDDNEQETKNGGGGRMWLNSVSLVLTAVLL